MFWLRALQRLGGCGGILTYHGVGPVEHDPGMHVTTATLSEQLEFVACEYDVLPLREYLARRAGGRSNRRCVALTFDDAYAGVRTEAAPVLRRLDVPATVFVIAAAAREGASFWWDGVSDALAAGGARWRGVTAGLGLPNGSGGDDVRETVLVLHAGRWPEAVPLSPGGGPLWRSMRFDELEVLARDERFDFGVHTVTHPALSRLEPMEQEGEMSAALSELRERLPRVEPVVAYPYGLFDAASTVAARRAGMVAGLTLKGYGPGRRESPWQLPRLGLSTVHACASIDARLTRALRLPLMVRKGLASRRGHRGRLVAGGHG